MKVYHCHVSFSHSYKTDISVEKREINGVVKTPFTGLMVKLLKFKYQTIFTNLLQTWPVIPKSDFSF